MGSEMCIRDSVESAVACRPQSLGENEPSARNAGDPEGGDSDPTLAANPISRYTEAKEKTADGGTYQTAASPEDRRRPPFPAPNRDSQLDPVPDTVPDTSYGAGNVVATNRAFGVLHPHATAYNVNLDVIDAAELGECALDGCRA